MYKVLIVEDEIPVRNKIIESVDWKGIGLEMAYAAGDGQEALEYLEDKQVELVLTDIYMPFIDGMELARRIRVNNQYCRIVFLTGYNEFDYAKEALELNASRYLLKPITRDELTEVLTEMKLSLDEEIEAKRNLDRLEGEYERSLKFLQDKLLSDIIAGFIPEDRTGQACASLNCHFEGSCYSVGILKVNNKEEVGQEVWSGDYSLLHFAMFNITREILSQKPGSRAILGDQGKIIIVFSGEDSEGFEKRSYDQLGEILHTIRHIYKMSLTGGLSSTYKTLSELKYAYAEALSALDYCVIEGSNRVIVTSDIEGMTMKNHQRLDETIGHIVAGLKVNDIDGASRHLKLFFEQLKFDRYSLNEVKTLILSLVTKIFEGYNQMCVHGSAKETLDFSLVEALFGMEDLSKAELMITDTLSRLGDLLVRSRQNDKVQIVLEAVKHIETTYMDPALDLKAMSDHLHVSASYFSRLFKKAKSMTFLEYLTAYRMEKAKELLKSTNLKVYEISAQVGYEDAHYFSYNFRKNVGTTPLKFRKA